MKAMDNAINYEATVESQGVDVLSGETEADKQLREATARLAAVTSKAKVSTTDWGKLGVAPTPTPQKRKVGAS